MTRRMVVCDLDGTLLTSAGRLSPRSRAVLRAVRRAGWPLLLCTARPVRDTRAVAVAIDAMMVAVCGNGSITYDFGRHRIVDEQPIPAAGLAATLRALRTAHPRVRFGAERGLDLLLEHDFELAATRCRGAQRVTRLDRVVDGRGFGKVIAQLDGAAPEYWPAIAAVLPASLTATVSTTAFCEIGRAGVTKAAAVRRIAGRSGVAAADVVAFGDMPNDLPLLTWAGTAVAVANAHPSVLAAADIVTATNDDDGVALVLEHLLDEGTGPR
ncbi:Cof-type HAD-IIB family hydrolase [Amorphoplanes nipponensis]|uniref:Haloacid dehalogenase n=1 Tax=Actinoplanes nipponensis TaxID=135950 RepID=A0A919JHU7_9ACTN|nr:HAD family hydrolase [Actinoplanes nipponensis]GIE47064.1 haloacid dehalogenase [Actinoplanes nipponensis]